MDKQLAKVGRDKAIDLAKRAVLTQPQWKDIEVAGALFTDDERWLVGVWKLPKKPGGAVLVEVFSDGRTYVWPGY